jgi:hypothetical protein
MNDKTNRSKDVLTFVIEDTTIFEGEYLFCAFVHVVKVMADLQPFKIP